MNKKLRRHLIINGSGVSAGGNFEKVIIRGDGTINGHINSNRVKSYGNADYDGSIRTKSTVFYGQSNISGQLESEKVRILGQAGIYGNALLQRLRMIGSVDIQGKLTGGDIKTYGEVTVKKDCDADSFIAKGVVTILGTLNAEDINIKLHFSDSQISEIGGKNIRIARGKMMSALQFFKLFSDPSVELHSDSIEGDHIHLENTNVKVVRGNHVTIGPGCQVQMVEYKNSLKKIGNATIVESKKV